METRYLYDGEGPCVLFCPNHETIATAETYLYHQQQYTPAWSGEPGDGQDSSMFNYWKISAFRGIAGRFPDITEMS